MSASPQRRISSVPAETITSRENRWIKRFRSALAGGLSGEAIGVEGARMVQTALRSGASCEAILVSQSGARHLDRLAIAAIPVLRTTDRLFGQIAGTRSPQGIAALVKPPAARLEDLVRGVPLILILAGVQDPGNVGALLRTAEAFGATGAAACAAAGIGACDPFSPKSLRASAGAALRLPILRGVGTGILLAQLRIAGVRVYATSPDFPAAVAPWEADWRSPSALLIGNEGAGLPGELIRSADGVVTIPHLSPAEPASAAESLNAAVAGSILLYEAARQRGGGERRKT